MKSYELLETKHPDLFRLVDRDGNWTTYFHKPSGRYLTGITTVLDRGYTKGAGYENWLSMKTPAEREAILQAAGENGDKVHRLIDTILSSGKQSFELKRGIKVFNRAAQQDETLSNDEWDTILAWCRFWLAHEPVTYASELSVYCLEHGYAGTGDFVGILTKACDVKTCRCEELVGKVGVFDWKTGGGIYASYWSQVSAIVNADNIREYLPAKAHIEYGAVLRIGTNHKTTGGYEFKTMTADEGAAAFGRFLSAKTIADFEHDQFDPDKIYEVPDAITVPVAVADLKEPEKKSAKKRTPKAPKNASVGTPKAKGKKSKKI